MNVKRVGRENARLLFSGFIVDPETTGSSWYVWIEREQQHRWRVEVDVVGFSKGQEETLELYDFDDAQLVDFAILNNLMMIKPYESDCDDTQPLKTYFTGWVDTHGRIFDPESLPPFTRNLLGIAVEWMCPELIELTSEFLCIHKGA